MLRSHTRGERGVVRRAAGDDQDPHGPVDRDGQQNDAGRHQEGRSVTWAQTSAPIRAAISTSHKTIPIHPLRVSIVGSTPATRAAFSRRRPCASRPRSAGSAPGRPSPHPGPPRPRARWRGWRDPDAHQGERCPDQPTTPMMPGSRHAPHPLGRPASTSAGGSADPDDAGDAEHGAQKVLMVMSRSSRSGAAGAPPQGGAAGGKTGWKMDEWMPPPRSPWRAACTPRSAPIAGCPAPSNSSWTEPRSRTSTSTIPPSCSSST